MTHTTRPLDIEVLRVFDDIVNDWGIPETSQRVARVRDALSQLSISQALLEESKTVLGQISRMRPFPDAATNMTTLSAARQIAASLIEKLEGRG